MAQVVENRGGVPSFEEGLDANKPAASSVLAGSRYWATDTNRMYRSTSSVWVALHATHNDLTGLTTGDPHTQYHNDARGDVRYYTKALSDGRYVRTVNGSGPDASGNVSVTSGGGASDPGYSRGASYKWNSTTSYSVLPGAAMVNGMLLSWSADIVRTPTLTANTLVYIYLYDNAGTPAALESTTAPVWDPALGYFKLGGGTPDATRRCLGFYQVNSAPAIRRFSVKANGRSREWIQQYGNVEGFASYAVVSGGSSAVANPSASLNLALFVPAHATHFLARVKMVFPAAGDEIIVGISPYSGISAANIYGAVRDAGPVAGARVFLPPAWVPLEETQTAYYVIQRITGLPTTDIECQGAMFSV